MHNSFIYNLYSTCTCSRNNEGTAQYNTRPIHFEQMIPIEALVSIRARICKRLRSPEIDAKESIPPGWELNHGRLKIFRNSCSVKTWMIGIGAQSTELTRGPPELVQHFAAFPKFDMVWLYRSPIPVGRRGVIS
jgi:hypothetical protein